MSFSDVYANEVLESRRTRSERARFWAKVVGFVLMITVGATLRSDPQLRAAIMTAGMDAVANLTSMSAQTAAPTSQPRDVVRVNRPGFGHQPSARFNKTQTADQETQATADQINELLKNIKIGQ